MRFDVFLESIAQMSVLGVNFLLDLDVSCEKLNLIIRQQEIMEPVIYWGVDFERKCWKKYQRRYSHVTCGHIARRIISVRNKAVHMAFLCYTI